MFNCRCKNSISVKKASTCIINFRKGCAIMEKSIKFAKVVELEKEYVVLLVDEDKNIRIPYDYFDSYPTIGEKVRVYQDDENFIILQD